MFRQGYAVTDRVFIGGVDNEVLCLVADQKFEETVGPLAQEALNLQKRNTTLRQTRDLLLPKLISGELDVSELDIDIRKTAA